MAFVKKSLYSFFFFTVATCFIADCNPKRNNVTDSNFSLSSEWLFLPDAGSNGTPAKLEKWNPLHPSSEWTRIEQYGEAVQYAWFRRDFIENNPTPNDSVAILLPFVSKTTQIYVNGMQISENSAAAQTPNLSENVEAPKILVFPNQYVKKGENSIYIKTGVLFFGAGFESDPEIGKLEDITNLWKNKLAFSIFLSSFCVFSFVYFSLIFTQRLKDTFYLHFSVLSISLALWNYSYKGYLLYIWNDNLCYYLFTYGSSIISALFLILFINSFLKNSYDIISKSFIFFYCFILSFLLIEIAITRGIYLYNKYLFEPFIQSIAILVVYLLAKVSGSVKAKKEYSISIMISLLILTVSVFYSVFVFLKIISADPKIVEGFIAMLLGFGVILSKRYSDTFNALETAQASLQILNESLETKVIERTRTIASQKEEIEKKTRILERDLEIAAKIQSALLPSDLPKIPSIRLAYRYEPMLDVGGDFVDSVVDRTGRAIGIFICDVTGHGTGAAMVASMVKMALLDWVDYLSDPGHMLTKMRAQLLGKLNGNFLTATIATFFPESGRLLIANAGHPETVILRRNFAKPELFRPSGMAINESMKTPYRTEITVLGPGDKLVLYTDGLPEARTPNGEFFGEENFFSLLSDCARLDPDPFCSTVIQHIRTFTENEQNSHDDMALIVLEYLGKTEEKYSASST